MQEQKMIACLEDEYQMWVDRALASHESDVLNLADRWMPDEIDDGQNQENDAIN